MADYGWKWSPLWSPLKNKICIDILGFAGIQRRVNGRPFAK